MKEIHRMAGKVLSLRLVSAIVLATSFSASVHAMSFGHSRLLSAVGQPLRIQVQVHEVTAQDLQSLSVALATAPAWQQAGLTPPVDLASMQVAVVDGLRPGSRVITVSSPQSLSGNVADLLLSVRSAAGEQQHQVSLLAPADLQVVAAATSQTDGQVGQVSVGSMSSDANGGQRIQVQKGDTLFALARRNAVPGVSLYQWMLAVQVANPSAFIRDNVNLLKAGATLVVPDHAALTAISDAQARRIFQQHSQAFAQYRQRLAAQTGAALPAGQTASGGVSAVSTTPPESAAPQSATDKVVLSSGQEVSGSSSTADDNVALQKNTQEARERLVDLEDNVKNLNEALQQQGAAASQVASDGVEALADAAERLADTVTQGLADAAGASGDATDGSGTTGTSALAATPAPGAAALADAVSAGSPSGSSGTSASAGPAEVTADIPALSGPAGTSSGGLPASAASAENSSSSASDSNNASKAATPVSWFQDNLLGIITGILALVVLVVAWLLRRAGSDRDDVQSTGITEDMVRERLQGINLDLDEPPATKPDSRG